MMPIAQIDISSEAFSKLLDASIGTLALIGIVIVLVVMLVFWLTFHRSLKIQEKQADNNANLVKQLYLMGGRVEKSNETMEKQADALKDIASSNAKRAELLAAVVRETKGTRQDVANWNHAAEQRAGALQGSIGDVGTKLETLSGKIDGLRTDVQAHTATDTQVLEVLGDVKEVLETLKRGVDDG